MDLMYQKMKELDSKMDELQEIVGNLSEQIKQLNSHQHKDLSKENDEYSVLSDMIPPPKNDYTEDEELNMHHKDILVGGNSWQYNSYRYKQMGMTAEVEIRRLTAQLTAAYSRIAALEDQLLSRKNAESKVIR